MRHRNVGPPIPGGHADLVRQVVNPEDGAPLVAADDHQPVRHAGQRIRHHLHEVRLPLSCDPTRVDATLPHEPVDDAALAKRADDDHVRALGAVPRDDRRHDIRNATDVSAQIVNGADHTRKIIRIDKKSGCDPVPDQRESARRRGERNHGLTAGHGPAGAGE